MNLTTQILQIISPTFKGLDEIRLSNMKLWETYQYSVKNRILLLYLEALKGVNKLSSFESIYTEECRKHLRTLDIVSQISQILKKRTVKHAIFKTIRPYNFTTVDIDILIFGDLNTYIKSIKILQNAGSGVIVYGPRSTTLYNKEFTIGIDLYEQVSVSYLIYMDKEKLADYITTARLPNGKSVEALTPEADLACIIAHSVIKEQMYTLSEYYTFIYYLKQMNIDDFVRIARQLNLISAARTHASITALLHVTAHGFVPDELQQILEILGRDNLETKKLTKDSFKTPHKYHPITVVKSLLETTKEKKNRNSMAMQIYQMAHPSFAKKFLKNLTEHITRETY